MKTKEAQRAKIKELIANTGVSSLDDQARALGLSRSTTWVIRNASHKASGISGATINRMFTNPHLPPLVRTTVTEYIKEKTAGLYGHNKRSLQRFNAALSIKMLENENDCRS